MSATSSATSLVKQKDDEADVGIKAVEIQAATHLEIICMLISFYAKPFIWSSRENGSSWHHRSFPYRKPFMVCQV